MGEWVPHVPPTVKTKTRRGTQESDPTTTPGALYPRAIGSPPPLAALGQANRTLVAALQQGAREASATLDVDGTIVESHKDAATVAYDGTWGYQPVLVLWAEQDVILHDQLRDGHVPAGCGNVRVLEQAVANLPQRVTRIRVRADSALYESGLLRTPPGSGSTRSRTICSRPSRG